MKRIIAALTGLAILGFAPLANASAFVSWSTKGAPQFSFRPTTPATPGATQDIILSTWYRNIQTGTLNPCGYKSVSKGTKAESINGFTLGTTVVSTSTLPIFDGTCNSTSMALVPKTEGSAIPTSHYMDPTGRLFVKPNGETFFQVALTNQTRTIKADKCGTFKMSWPAAREGQTAIAWDSTTTVNGTTYNLEDLAQTAPEGICSGRWGWSGFGVLERIHKFFQST